MNQLYRRRPDDTKWEVAPRDEDLSCKATGFIHAYFNSQAEADKHGTFNKLTSGEYTKWEIDYYNDPVLRKQCRLGQAFMNECVPRYIIDPDLFHERNKDKAVAIIFERYIKKD